MGYRVRGPLPDDVIGADSEPTALQLGPRKAWCDPAVIPWFDGLRILYRFPRRPMILSCRQQELAIIACHEHPKGTCVICKINAV